MTTLAMVRAQAAELNIRVWHDRVVDRACTGCGEVTAVPAGCIDEHPDDPGALTCANCPRPDRLITCPDQPDESGWWWEREGDVEGPYDSELEALMQATLDLVDGERS